MEVVSVAGLKGQPQSRIGVKSLRSHHCDAVPVEAILSLLPPAEYSASNIETSIDKVVKTKSKRKVEKLGGPKGNKTAVIKEKKASTVTKRRERDVDCPSMLSNLSLHSPELKKSAREEITDSAKDDSIQEKVEDDVAWRPLSRTTSSVSLKQSTAPIRKSTSRKVLHVPEPDREPDGDTHDNSITETLSEFPKNYSWLKLVTKNTYADPNPVSEAVNQTADPRNIELPSKKRKELSYQTLNLTFDSAHPVVPVAEADLSPRRSKPGPETNRVKTKLMSSDRVVSQEKDKPTFSRNNDAKEFISLTNRPASNEVKVNPQNNNGSSHLVRPKSAPSTGRRRPNVDSEQSNGRNPVDSSLEVQGTNPLGRGTAVTAADLLVAENGNTDNGRREGTQAKDDKILFDPAGDSEGKGAVRRGRPPEAIEGSSSRPSSAGFTRLRRKKNLRTFLLATNDVSPEPNVVPESQQGTNLRLKKTFVESHNLGNSPKENERIGSHGLARDQQQQQQRQRQEKSQEEKDKEREDQLRRREASLSEKEAAFKESYLRRQLRRMGVGVSET